ncbi:hypothetical protein BKA65DRAFT_401885 [Rhexocercosporidium sp. MPI-PUGE-AT-0058]|nr:hypothetical protein BKA65DRAFT_401885 [Rhexocercosporidium sp. MPI-PUGE-AT-0058]
MPPHTEKSCQLCAIPFAIGRVRTTHEPLSLGWDPTGSSYHHRSAATSLCSLYPSESGCENVVVATPPNLHAESRYQHLAGPGCTFEGGYNGNRIGEREMRGVNRVRYVLRKQKDRLEVERESEDEDEEMDSEFFVSVETVDVPIESGNGKLSEELYGISSTDFKGQNYPTTGYRGQDDVAIPVHDACWKIFERVSMKMLGRVDVDGFVALWWREAWTEYLAANPLDIPGFKLMMRGVYKETPRGDGAFVAKDSYGALSKRSVEIRRYQNETDPFNRLPTELKNKVLVRLSPKDITNLRLSSRSFRQLPKQIFKQFITEEIPWFWEIDEVRADVEAHYQASFTEEYGDDLDMLESIIPPAWFAFVKERIEKKPMDINWYQVYKQLKVMEKGSLGLRNRKRIWKVAEEVVGRVEGMRKSLEGTRSGFVVYPMEMEGKDGDGKDHSCCPACSNVQIELEDEEDIFEKDSEGESSRGSSVSEGISSSDEDSE